MTMSTKRGWLIVSGIVGVAALGLVLAFARRGEAEPSSTAKPEKRAVAVTVEPVTGREVRRTVMVVGTLYGKQEVMLTPRVEGRVHKIHKDVGDTVRPGELLLEIEPIDYQLAVAEARRSL